MLGIECHVRKGRELAQVSFDSAALFDACEINCEISFDKYGIKRSRKSYLSSKSVYYFDVKMISHYASVKLFSDSHGIPQESVCCNTDGKSVWTAGETVLKNKPYMYLVKFDHCIIASV